MIKVISIVFFLGVTLMSFKMYSQDNSTFIYHRNIVNPILRENIKEYIDLFNDSIIKEGLGIPVVKIFGEYDTISAYISYEIYKDPLLTDLPSYYSTIDNVPILIYTGHQDLFETSIEYLDIFFQKYKDRLYSKEQFLTFDNPVLRVDILQKNKVIKKQFVDLMPYELDPWIDK